MTTRTNDGPSNAMNDTTKWIYAASDTTTWMSMQSDFISSTGAQHPSTTTKAQTNMTPTDTDAGTNSSREAR